MGYNLCLNEFRQQTPLERSSLARAKSDQDHLECMHAKFIKGFLEYLSEINRNNSCPIILGSILMYDCQSMSKSLTAVF